MSTLLLLLVLVAVILASFGQISMKYGMNLVGPLVTPGNPGITMLLGLGRAVFTPFVLLGLGLYAVSAGFWLVVLKQAQQLSYVYPMIASTYVFVLFLSWLLLHEQLPAVRIAGVVLICIGVVFVARS